MQFQVPQFIDIEDRIFGPLTLKQFLYLAGAGAFSFILFFTLQTPLWIGVTAVLGGIAVAFAFVRPNGQPMTRMAAAMFWYAWKPRFYLWRYVEKGKELPMVRTLPARTEAAAQSPLKALMLRFSGGRSSNK